MPIYRLGSGPLRPRRWPQPIKIMPTWAAIGGGATLAYGGWTHVDVVDTDFVYIECQAYGVAGSADPVTFNFHGTCTDEEAPVFPTMNSFSCVVTTNGATVASDYIIVDTRALRAICLDNIVNGDASDAIAVQCYFDTKDYVEREDTGPMGRK